MNYILYHANCVDGFTAYWVTQKALTLMHQPWVGVPGKYGTFPAELNEINGMDTLYMVDFSLPVEQLREIIAKEVNVVWIDHHVSAYEMYHKEGLLEDPYAPLDDEYNGEPITDWHYSVERSGATLCWNHFSSTFNAAGIERPLLLNYVEDRDLWKHKLAGTHEINTEIFSHKYSLETWDELMSKSLAQVLNMQTSGAGILRKLEKDIDEILEASKHVFYVDEYTVWACNLPYMMASDAGHKMCQMPMPNGMLPAFAVTYQIQGNKVLLSFRSETEHGADVSLIAKKFGGGGHKNAAGASISYDTWMMHYHGIFSQEYLNAAR